MHDIVLSGGSVIDGLGGSAATADVGVTDGRVSGIGRIDRQQARRFIDVSGAVVCPGFIDLHSHADYTIFGAPQAVTQSAQGVTTLVTGNCGFSPFPVSAKYAEELRAHSGFLDDGLPWEWSTAAEYAAAVEGLPLGVNIAPQLGHAAVRIAVLGLQDRAPNAAELQQMQELAASAFTDGAAGLSTGLIYAPASFATTSELVAVASEAARAGRLYSTHMRDEGDRLGEAVEEALAVGRRAGVRVEISHLKAVGPDNWGAVAAALDRITQARQDGIDVHADQYPYSASSTTLTSRLPGWAMDGGVPELLRRLEEPATCHRIAAELEAGGESTFLPDRIVIADTPEGPYQPYVGYDIAAIAAQQGLSPAQTTLDILRKQQAVVSIISHGMAEQDVRTVLADPSVSVASDGWILRCPGAGVPHPRSFGTFTRVLGHYVRADVLALETAVAKMTSLPACRLGWTDRGVLRPGAIADVACFDPVQVDDPATYAEPWQLATGVLHTLLGGRFVWYDGAPTGEPAGRVVRTR